MSNRAWVTLATNDSYSLGALVLAHSLRRVGSTYPAVVLITPSVTDAMRDRLRAVFAEVVVVDILDSRDAAHLALLQRPELGITFTKIHCWNLTQYEKCVFLDADILVVQNCDELFEREELSAAPDVGWPDCFNSGVFVFKPSNETFNHLVQFAQQQGSFDGGDQGLLNSYFSDWARGDINKHLPFLYNVTSAAFYSYLPALKHYGQNLKIIHFIGAAKPWLQHFNWTTRSVDAPSHLREFLQLWWSLFVSQVHAELDVSMSGVAGNFARVSLDSGAQQAIDDLTRRQGWEAGNIDYMGADSFDNIWAKISQTLSQPRKSPPKQTSPPKEIPLVEPTAKETEVQAPESTKESTTDTAVEQTQIPIVEAVPVVEPIEVASEAVPIEAATSEQDTTKTSVCVATSVTPVAIPESKTASEPTLADTFAPVTASVEQIATIPEPVQREEIVAAETAALDSVLTPTVEPKIDSVVATEPQSTKIETPASTESAAPLQPSSASKNSEPVTELPASEIPVTVEAIEEPVQSTKSEAAPQTVTEAPKTEEIVKPTVVPEVAGSPTVVDIPKVSEPVQAPPSPAPAAEAPPVSVVPEATPEKAQVAADTATDSPPLANTPSKEEAPAVPATKSTEEAAQETRL